MLRRTDERCNVQPHLDPFFEVVECACVLVPLRHDCETFRTSHVVSTREWIPSAPIRMLAFMRRFNVFSDSDLAVSGGSRCRLLKSKKLSAKHKGGACRRQIEK